MSESPTVPPSPSYPPYYVATYNARTVAIKRDPNYDTTIKIIQKTIHKLRCVDPCDICLSTTLPEYGDTLVQITEEMWPDVAGLIKNVEVTLEELSDPGDGMTDAGLETVVEDLKKLDLDETIPPASAKGEESRLPEPDQAETNGSQEALAGRESNTINTTDEPPKYRLKKPPRILVVVPEPRPPPIDCSQQNNPITTHPSPPVASRNYDTQNLGTGAHQHRAVPLPPRGPPPRTPPPPTPPQLPPQPTKSPAPAPVSTGDEWVDLGAGTLPDNTLARSPLRKMKAPPGGTTRPLVTRRRGCEIAPQATPNPTRPINKTKISVAIDFGTMFSGVAYGSPTIAGGRVQLLQQWPSGFDRKVPTCMLYRSGQVSEWGRYSKSGRGLYQCSKFKLFLDPQNLRRKLNDPHLPVLPVSHPSVSLGFESHIWFLNLMLILETYIKPGKRPLDVIADFLTCLWKNAKQQISNKVGTTTDLDSADVWLTVPARWDAQACSIMREAAVRAGIVQRDTTTEGIYSTRSYRLKIITELEAAAVYCTQLTSLHQLHPDQHMMICNAGEHSVDLAIYKVLGSPTRLEIGEACIRTGADCGSQLLELRFRDAVAELLKGHSEHGVGSLSYFQAQFATRHKLTFTGEVDDNKPFEFDCLNFACADDPSIGISKAKLTIQGIWLRARVFDPVIAEVLELIEAQLNRFVGKVDALMLVGGFSHNEYLLKHINERFRSRIEAITRPVDIDTAICRGAARCGLTDYELVPVVIAPRAYMMKGNKPGEPEDHQKRPQYMGHNKAGADVCQNRLHYLVRKGASLRKEDVVVQKLRKFSKDIHDSIYTGILYTSDSDRDLRYTDEESVVQMCTFKVDLSLLPDFGPITNDKTEFVTRFELSFEFHSAEVRGTLRHRKRDWSPIVFEFPESYLSSP
ncbi:hypothetical protein FRC09_003157 [Ceratobasidium sp. 395]|nr:hypothetical protein FRC09_003157 [Ceratobasidium sp. 395]